MIIADTGAILALIDADDRSHPVLRELWERDPGAWILPWAILPEVDHLLGRHLGAEVQLAFLADLVERRWTVEWGDVTVLARARELSDQYRDLRMGMVDAVVMAMAERPGVRAIATLDERHFGAVRLKGEPPLWPRDAVDEGGRGKQGRRRR